MFLYVRRYIHNFFAKIDTIRFFFSPLVDEKQQCLMNVKLRKHVLLSLVGSSGLSYHLLILSKWLLDDHIHIPTGPVGIVQSEHLTTIIIYNWHSPEVACQSVR